MFRRTFHPRAFVNGAAIGSQGQKHQSYCPTMYLYRFAGSRGPGPVLMKYWHTLGCFPTGIEVPFRLHEFHQSYIREHVPEELEDWLRCVVYDPADTIDKNMGEFLTRLSNSSLPKSRASVLPRSELLNAKQIHAPLQKVFDEFGVEIPVVAVRAAASSKRIKEDLLDVAFAYHETVQVIGSTPHRRWAASSVLPPNDSNNNLLSSSSLEITQKENTKQTKEHYSEKELTISKTLHSVLNISSANSTLLNPDEALACKMLTTLAEGCHRGTQGRSNEAAKKLLQSALNFVGDKDPIISSATHSNLASAYAASGEFDQAVLHAKEGVLKNRKNPRSHAAWAVATALKGEQDLDSALEISANALDELPDSPVLQQVHEQLCRAACGRVSMQNNSSSNTSSSSSSIADKRYKLQSQCQSALMSGSGRMFDNEFDTGRLNGKRIATRLDPTSASLGSDYRRAHIGSGPICSTNMEESA